MVKKQFLDYPAALKQGRLLTARLPEDDGVIVS